MTTQTSIVRSNTGKAVQLIQRATSVLSNDRTNVSAREALASARNLLNNSLDNYLKPTNLYPRAILVMQQAACIVTDYWNQFAQTQVSIPPPQSTSVMTDDMNAVSALVTRSAATFRAIANGNWSNTAIWHNATVPTEGARVHISAGRNVTYNVKATVCIKTLGVFGTLSVARNTSTRLVCDTFVVGETGTLNINTSSAYTTSVEFAGASISTAWDSRMISRGLIVLGNSSIVGATVTPFVMIDHKASAAATQVSCMTSVVGWRAGDKVFITPVRLGPKFQRINPGTTAQQLIGLSAPSGITSVLQVSALSGNRVIKMTTALQRSYQVPDFVSNGLTNVVGVKHRPYIWNTRRNIVFRTQNAQASSMYSGHTMFMMGVNTVKYAKFKHLGRTKKRVQIDSIDNLQANASLNSVTPITPTRRVVSANANPKGRYSVHYHRIGVGTTDTPGVFSYNYVSGAPGWGIAHHDSYVNITDNVVYDYFGAGIVAEVGSERGKWNRNLVCLSRSTNRHGLKDIGPGNDIFRNGEAYALASRNISVVGNVACAYTMVGYGWLLRGGEQVPVPSSTLELPEANARYDWQTAPDNPRIRKFKKNRAFCGHLATHIIKSDPNQRHQLRTMITSLIAWEVTRGYDIQYTAHYTLRKCEFVGAKNYTSALQRPDQSSEAFTTGDFVLASVYLRGFRWGLDWQTQPTNGVSIWAYPTSIKGYRKNNTDYSFLNFNGLFFVNGAVTSMEDLLYPNNGHAQAYRGTLASLQGGGSLSVRYTSATRYGNTWISQRSMTGSGTRLYRIRGSIRDTLGETSYPIVFQADGNVDQWNTSGVKGKTSQLIVQRNILKNFGYFQVSNVANGLKQYVVIRDYFTDRYTGSVEYRQYGWKVSTTPISSWGGVTGSVRMIQKVTTIASIVVPAWDGRARYLVS